MAQESTNVGRVAIGGGLDEFEAAAFLSLPIAVFRHLVAQGALPLPRIKGQRKRWDAESLDRAFSGRAGGSSEQGWVKLKNVDRFIDRHGKPRHYYRAGKGARICLPGEPGSPEFMDAYEQAKHMQTLEQLAVPDDASISSNFSAIVAARGLMFVQGWDQRVTPWS